MGVKPALGTALGTAEDKPKGPAVTVISHDLWRRRFGSDPQIAGKTLVLNNRAHVILGVMPEGFSVPPKTDLWTPLQIDPQDLAPSERHYLDQLARLRPGVSLAQAESDMNSVARRFTEREPIQYPADSGWGVRLVPLVDQVVGDTRPALLILLR